MKTINLRHIFPEYELDCFIELPDSDVEAFTANLTRETAYVYIEFQREENNYNRRVFRHKAQYSLDQGDGIENEVVEKSTDPFETYTDKLVKQELYDAIKSLPQKQGERIYTYLVLGMSKAEIARREGVDEKNVRQAIERGLEKMKNILKNFSE